MRMLTSCALTALACGAFAASACESPSMIKIPDGKTSTMDQLLAAQAEVKSYMAAMEEYIACVDSELDSQGEAAPEEFRDSALIRALIYTDYRRSISNPGGQPRTCALG